MFEEDTIEQAANVETSVENNEETTTVADTDSNTETQPTSPVETIDQTKAFAKRLKEESEKIKMKERENIAKQFGYDDWDSYVEEQTNSKLLNSGLDPEVVLPTLKDLMKNDPEYIEAMKYKAEKEELEKELFASDSIKALNSKYGTNYKSVNDLDEDTVNLWNSGVPLDKAYAANNVDSIVKSAIKKSSQQDSGKNHLTNINSSTITPTVREPSKGEMDVFKAFGISEQAARDFLNKKD